MYHAGTCKHCLHQGLLEYVLCKDGETIVLMCDECEMTYLSPELKDLDVAEKNVSHSFLVNVGSRVISIAGGRSATRDEIVAKGWEDRIEGEYHKVT